MVTVLIIPPGILLVPSGQVVVFVLFADRFASHHQARSSCIQGFRVPRVPGNSYWDTDA